RVRHPARRAVPGLRDPVESAVVSRFPRRARSAAGRMSEMVSGSSFHGLHGRVGRRRGRSAPRNVRLFRNAVNPSMEAPGAPSLARTVLKRRTLHDTLLSGGIASMKAAKRAV